jgi:hypothetical protein
MNRKIVLGFSLFFMLSTFFACNALKDISKMVTNLQKCQFKLENVNGFKLAGVELGKIKSLKDFNILEGAKLLQTFNKKKVPVSFTLNVAALNPNDGTSGTSKSSVTLKSLDWKLLIDGVQTIAGVVNTPIELPGNNQKTIIPLEMNLDLYEFFGNKGYESLINTALAIGGVNGSASKLTLTGKPTISTPFGAMAYPGEIQIIEKEFRGN